MNIKYYIPTQFNHIINIIWEQRYDRNLRWKILPSGFVELIFNLGTDTKSLEGKLVGSNTYNPINQFCFLSGLHTKPLYLDVRNFHTLGIQMNPIAIKALFGIPCAEVKDWAIDGVLLLKNLNIIEDKLLSTENFIDKAKWLEKFILAKICESKELFNAFNLNKAVNHIISQRLLGKIEPFEKLTGYSRTQTFRICKEWFGLSKVNYLKLAQYVHSLKEIHSSKSKLTNIAINYGYYDQAHFINTFKQFTDTTPRQYRNSKTNLIGQLPF